MPTSPSTARLRENLSTYLAAGDAEALRDRLKTLRHAEFRAAGSVMCEGRFWETVTEAEFWRFFLVLAADNAKAYVGTMLKAAAARHCHRPLVCEAEAFRAFAQDVASDIDRRKTLDALLPLFDQEEKVERLMTLFRVNEENDRVRAGYLFRAGTPVCYFLLFRLLKKWEDDVPTLRRFAVELIRKGDKSSFNLACILREYFNLDEVPGTFSLRLPAYELSRLDAHPEAFLKILLR